MPDPKISPAAISEGRIRGILRRAGTPDAFTAVSQPDGTVLLTPGENPDSASSDQRQAAKEALAASGMALSSRDSQDGSLTVLGKLASPPPPLPDALFSDTPPPPPPEP